MAVYFITGKLGAGKSLTAVWRIREYLNNGLPVATNLDLKLWYLLGKDKKKTRVIRVPDHPKIEDLKILGSANTSFDESKNGLLVLDECATWFNSRSWNDKERQYIIDWLVHSRKLGWDVLFLVQDFSVVDKQARLMLGEHVVTCMRTDRFLIPILGKFLQFFFGLTFRIPKAHVATVKYGSKDNAHIIEWWKFVGTGLYRAYDTKQKFLPNYIHGTYSYLPPFYTHGQYAKPKDGEWYMRLTKIWLRRWRRLPLVLVGICCGVLVASLLAVLVGSSPASSIISQTPEQIQEKTENLDAEFKPYQYLKIHSYSNFPGQSHKYTFKDKDGTILTETDFKVKGFMVFPVDSNNCVLAKGGRRENIKR